MGTLRRRSARNYWPSVDRGGDFFTPEGASSGLSARAAGRRRRLHRFAAAAGPGGALIAVAEAAPYGRGTETLVDPSVRRTWQIAPDRVRIQGRHWQQHARRHRGPRCRRPRCQRTDRSRILQAADLRRGKLLRRPPRYREGGRMFATLVIVLPSCSNGGELMRPSRRVVKRARSAARRSGRGGIRRILCGLRARGAAGHRRLSPRADLQSVAPQAEGSPYCLPTVRNEKARIEERTARLAVRGRPEKLVYPLEHAYTPAEIAFDALKGADAGAAGVLAAAAAPCGM